MISHAGAEFRGRRAGGPTGDVRMGAVSFTEFRDDVGVEEEPQRSTSRHLSFRVVANTPSNASSGRSDPNTSRAVSSCGLPSALRTEA